MFVWLIYYTFFRIEVREEGFSLHLLKGFFTSPIVVGILSGFLLNIFGFSKFFETNSLLIGINATLAYLGAIATPLILIAIGYGLKMDRAYIGKCSKFVLARFVVIFTVGYAFKFLVIDRILIPTEMFNYAFFTLLLLPPVFSTPILFGEAGRKEEESLANNIIVLNTVVSLTVFMISVAFIG